MRVSVENIEGEIVKDNETYILEDNNTLENLTLSRTILKPGMKTRGHSHESQEEVYFFHGYGGMVLGENSMTVEPGSVVLIPKGTFHQVINFDKEKSLSFVCVFEKYDRSSDVAEYKK